MAAPNEITVHQLLRLIGTPDCPVIIDVCIDDDFTADPFLIPGSIRCDYDDIERMKADSKGRRVIVVCQKGKKLSQGVAAWLNADGIEAEYLQGGMFGWRETKDALRVPAKIIPITKDQSTLWVTRHRPKIDRIACPWLIRRFVDRSARFLFVAPNEVSNVAEKFDATPFDVEGVFWSHRAENCTFDTMLDEFNLRTPALDRLSTVIRAADTNKHDLSAEAAGLLAISVGLSRQYRHDQEHLERGMQLYDALYRWARDGQNETHTWPTGGK